MQKAKNCYGLLGRTHAPNVLKAVLNDAAQQRVTAYGHVFGRTPFVRLVPLLRAGGINAWTLWTKLGGEIVEQVRCVEPSARHAAERKSLPREVGPESKPHPTKNQPETRCTTHLDLLVAIEKSAPRDGVPKQCWTQALLNPDKGGAESGVNGSALCVWA